MEEFLKRLMSQREEAAKERETLVSKRQAILDVAEAAGLENLTEVEDGEFRSFTKEIEKTDARISGLDERIEEQRAEIARSGKLSDGDKRLREARRMVESVREQATYVKGDPRRSYLKDMVTVAIPGRADADEARERLNRHAMDVDSLPEYRNLNRTDGSGGYAVPPAWLVDQYIALARAGRPVANVVQNQVLPGGTNSINIPKLATGTATAIQNGDNTNVQETDLTDSFVTAPVQTIAGQQGLSIQLLDQSPIAFDEVVFRDLTQDHAAKVDQQVLYGSGGSGQVQGIHGTSNILSVASNGTTIAYVYAAVANAIQQIHANRFLPPDVIVMHPRRWGWFLSLLDSSSRPLFLPNANNPVNAGGILEKVDSQQVVGQMHGLPVITDPNLTTTNGAGSNQDYVYVLRASDLILWESGLRTRVLPETRATSLTVLLQVFSYVAFSAGRYPQSVAEITGLTAPTWGS
jgi:HK97 family phage major capsid protein